MENEKEYKYDYKKGKERILNILNDENEIEEVESIPQDNLFTYDNGYYGDVSSIFVDIRDSTSLFAENRKKSTARIIRSFTSEIIEILHNDDNLREIGIRGDCVYAIYSTPHIEDDNALFNKCVWINTFLGMLNELLIKKNLTTISAGIGVATSKDLVVKAGRNGTGIKAKVWIGKAVTYASKLSNMANKNGEKIILMNDAFYKSIIEKETNENEKAHSWFITKKNDNLGTYYGCNIIKKVFKKWIEEGMKS